MNYSPIARFRFLLLATHQVLIQVMRITDAPTPRSTISMHHRHCHQPPFHFRLSGQQQRQRHLRATFTF